MILGFENFIRFHYNSYMNDSEKKTRQKRAAALFWLGLTIFIVVIFLIKKDTMFQVLKDTAFFKHVFGKDPEFIANYADKKETKNNVPDNDSSKAIIIDSIPQEEIQPVEPNTAHQQDVFTPNTTEQTNQDQTTKPVFDTQKNESTQTATKPLTQQSEDIKTEQQKKESQNIATTTQVLYFMAINGDGSVERKIANRTVQKSNAPLTESIKSLLTGPNIAEQEKEYISLIPPQTKLLSAQVENKIATLNFNEAFMFNRYGIEGYLGQLTQIVYTATTFNTIDAVQFLIDGEKHEYLGGDGVWIGSPLTREYFK